MFDSKLVNDIEKHYATIKDIWDKYSKQIFNNIISQNIGFLLFHLPARNIQQTTCLKFNDLTIAEIADESHLNKVFKTYLAKQPGSFASHIFSC